MSGMMPDGSSADDAVAIEVLKLQIRDRARQLVRMAQAGPRGARPAAITLAQMLAEPDEPLAFRVDRLWPAGGRVMLAAQYKAGKTTLVGNLIRALVDGGRFLDDFEAVRPAGPIVLVDTELGRGMLRGWLRDQSIRDADRVIVYPLRGRLASFDLTDPAIRRDWAVELRHLGAAVLILDCLRPVLDAIGLDENTEAGRFLVAFDAMLNDAGIADALVTHHMGHTGERSRGSSRLRDWPDAEWRLVRERPEDDDPAAPRYFSAYGRDVEVAESALSYDSATRRLSLSGAGNRKQAAGRAILPDLLALLGDTPAGLSGRQIEDALMHADKPRHAIRQAVKIGTDDGDITVTDGPRRSKIHQLNPSSAPVRRSAPPVRQRTESECASAPIGGALHSLNADGPIEQVHDGALEPALSLLAGGLGANVIADHLEGATGDRAGRS